MENEHWELDAKTLEYVPRKTVLELLADLLKDGNIKIRFGLVQQGHIPTIEAALKAGESWTEIGRKIGWCPKTAQKHYEYYLHSNSSGASGSSTIGS